MKWISFAAIFLAAFVFGGEEANRAEIDRLVALLEADTFKERKQTQADLVAFMQTCGVEGWHYLAAIDTSKLPESELRIEKVLQKIEGTVAVPLLDANGKPIPNAVCELYRIPKSTYLYNQEGATFVGRTFADAKGIVKLPGPTVDDAGHPGILGADDPFAGPGIAGPGEARQPRFQIDVFAPGFGSGGCIWPERGINRDKGALTLPLVHEDSEQAERGVSGVVRDENGEPVRRACVMVRSIELPGLGGYNAYGETVALTDHRGRFRIYKSTQRLGKKLLPKNALMQLEVSGEGRFPAKLQQATAEEAAITLRRGTLQHRFTFEGGIDPRKASYVQYIGDKSRHGEVTLDRSFLTEGGLLVPGRYRGRMGELEFEDIVVTEDSPELLEFKRKAERKIAGRVLDGRSGKGARAIVFGYTGTTGGYLIDITREDIEALLAQPDDNLREHPTFDKLAGVYRIVCISRANAEGRYRIDPKGQKIYGVIALAPGMLPVTQRAVFEEDEDNGEGDQILPALHLFPAAKVRLEAVYPGGEEPKKTVKLWPEFRIVPEQKQAWLPQFEQTAKAREGSPGFYPTKYSAPAGEERLFYVPADLEFRMTFSPSYNKQWGPLIFDKKMRVGADEILDLGRGELTPTVEVRVKVVGPEGQPVEGVGVRHSYERKGRGTSWSTGETTDQQGLVTRRVAPGMKGQFGVLNLRGPQEIVRAPNLRTAFELDGPTEKVFEIRLNEAQMKLVP